MTPKKPETAVAKVDATSYPVLARDDAAENLALTLPDVAATPWELKKLTVPAGGGRSWEIETLDGVETFPTIDIVIAMQMKGQRSWWREAIGEREKQPPDCSSTDGLHGFGDRSLVVQNPKSKVPGDEIDVMGEPEDLNLYFDEDLGESHDCPSCLHQQFGSSRASKDARGQDCAEKIHVYFFRAGSMLPWLLPVPPASLKRCREYNRDLLDKGLSPYRVVTRLSLEQHSGPPVHSRIKFEPAGELTEEQAERLKSASVIVKENFGARSSRS